MQKSFLLISLLCVIAFLHLFPVEGGTGQTIVGDLNIDPVLGLDASETRFRYLSSFCLDPRNGDMYVADDHFNKVFKIDHQTNVVSWFAGNGVETKCARTGPNYCNDKTDKLSAGFRTPFACTVDPNNGDVYLVDYFNHMVRRIDVTTNISSIFVGTGSTTGSNTNYNGLDALHSTVALNSPISVLVDSTFVYITDSMNHCIRKINKISNLVYTHAGSCGTSGSTNGNTPTAARFNNPYGMALAADGTMFVADKANHIIRRINPDGSVELYAGTVGTQCPSATASPACGDGSDRLSVTFTNPNAVIVDSNNNVYVFDYGNFRIRKIDNSTGLVSTLVGTGASTGGVTGGPGGHGQVGTSVIISASSNTFQPLEIVGNRLLFHDKTISRVRQFDLNTRIVTSIVGSGVGFATGVGLPLINSRFSSSPVMQFDSIGTPYIFTGSNPSLLLTVTPSGIVKRLAGGNGVGTPVYSDVPGDQIVFSTGGSPVKLAINKSNNQDIYIADQAVVRYYNITSGRMYTYAGGGASSTSGTAALSFSFGTLSSIDILSNGDLVVTSTTTKIIRKIVKSSGTVVAIANSGNMVCSSSACGDGGQATAATFSNSIIVAVDSNDNIYVMDNGVYVLRMIRASNGNIERVAGTYTTICSDGNCGDGGSALSAKLTAVKNIEIHPITGDIYLAEANRIRKISGGIISTVVGAFGRNYDSLVTGAWANPLDVGIAPTRISFSPTGQLYFNDGSSYWSMRTLKDGLVRPVSGFLISTTDRFNYNGEDLLPTKVKLSNPTSVFLDSNGNVFVGCSGTSSTTGGENDARIVKVDVNSNTASTFIGTLTEASAISENTIRTKTSLKPYASIYTGLYTPFGIHVTPNGDVYFADPSRYVIRMYNATLGTVSTIAGTMNTVCTDSICDNGQPALSAHFKLPTSIFVTDDGTIYVSDTQLHQIRKIQNGIITAIAGTGTQCTTAGSNTCDHGSTSPLRVDLYTPMGIYVTKSGEVYFADTSNHKVRKISSDGLTITTVAGSAGNCASGTCATFSASATDSTAKLFYPTGVVVNETSGSIYIADQGTHTIRVVSSNGSMSVYAGTFPGMAFNDAGATQFSAEGSSKYLNLPTSIFLKDNSIYVTEPVFGRVRRVTQNCRAGYGGDNCETPICFEILATYSTVCSGNGACIESDTCQCNAGSSGSNCSQTTSNCRSGFYGSNCEISNCYGKFSNDSSVCSGHGRCNSTDSCSCSPNYFGGNCQITTCFNTQSNDSSVCSGHGVCSSYDQCSCNSNYYGYNCNITTCGGVFSNDSSVCSGNGNCVDFNQCNCVQNSGSNCAEPIIPTIYCFGILANDSNICSGNGQCNATDICICDSLFSGFDCSNDTSNANNNSTFNNNTNTDNSTNTNNNNYGNNTNINNSTNTNNSNNFDNSTSTNNDTNTDNSTNTNTNNNNSTNSGNNTNINNSTNTNNSNNGTNSGNTNNTNNADNQWSCFGIANNNSSVCSRHGTCKSLNVCECKSGYTGSDCELRTCFGVANNNPNSCSARGNCTNVDTCECRAGYSGSNCEQYTCNGILFSNSTVVCSGNGNCTAPNICSCASHAEGSWCDITYCNGISSSNNTVCNGHGNCVSGACSCAVGYFGKGCEQYVVSGSTFVSGLGVYHALFVFITSLLVIFIIN